jgi:hypothetical protein
MVRDRKNKEKLWNVRRVNEQVRSPDVGKKTAVGVDSEILQREMNAQRVASVRLNPQVRGGSVKRDGADISYYLPTSTVSCDQLLSWILIQAQKDLDKLFLWKLLSTQTKCPNFFILT